MADPYAGIPGLEEEAAAIARRRKIAEAMMARGQEPVQPFVQAGRMVAPMSWTQGLAQMLNAYLGKKGIEKAEKAETGLADKRQQMIADAMTGYEQQSRGLPPIAMNQTRIDEGTGARQPVNIPLEGVPGDPEGALFNLLGNPAVPDATRQAATLKYQAGLRREDKEDERQFRAEQAELSRQAKMDELQAKLADSRLNAQDRNALMRELALLRADTARDVADTKIRMAKDKEQKKEQAALASTTSSMDRLAAEANRLLEHPGLVKATGIRDWLPLVGGLATVPGTDAANFKASLNTLKSQVGFSVLQAMRDAAKTGGALGQISDRENILLQDNLAALDSAQSPDEFKAALRRIIDYTNEAKERMRGAVEADEAASDTVLDFNSLPP